VRWLLASGESTTAQGEPRVEVVEHFQSYLLPDGYEVNATFEDDHRPTSEDEVESALRRLELAHERLERAIAEAGPGPLSGEGRTKEEVVAHVVRAERWLATRVEPDQRRIRFPTAELSATEQLAENPAFVSYHVRRAGMGDAVHARIDSKGEGWTTRKVLRRLVYHVLDHAHEIEQRHAGRLQSVERG